MMDILAFALLLVLIAVMAVLGALYVAGIIFITVCAAIVGIVVWGSVWVWRLTRRWADWVWASKAG